MAGCLPGFYFASGAWQVKTLCTTVSSACLHSWQVRSSSSTWYPAFRRRGTSQMPLTSRLVAEACCWRVRSLLGPRCCLEWWKSSLSPVGRLSLAASFPQKGVPVVPDLLFQRLWACGKQWEGPSVSGLDAQGPKGPFGVPIQLVNDPCCCPDRPSCACPIPRLLGCSPPFVQGGKVRHASGPSVGGPGKVD